MPREPPVTTATLPSTENRSLTADIVAKSGGSLRVRDDRGQRQRLRAGAGLRRGPTAASAPGAASTSAPARLGGGRRRRRRGGGDEAPPDHDRLGGPWRPGV